MSDKKNYVLTKRTFVTSINPSDPLPAGSVWAPTDEADVQEAQALARAGFAKLTNEKATHITRSDVVAGKPPISGIVEKPVQRDDGTFVNKNGVRVNADGSDFDQATQALSDFLGNNADDVIAAIANVNGEDKASLPALRDLEAGKTGKQRKTVLAAIDAAMAQE